jgi:hypothetical protein
MSDSGPAPAEPAITRARWLTTCLVLAAAVAFGAADQYIGSRYWLFATAVSGMSAPWLLLPFIAGLCSSGPRRAAWLGFAATWLAIVAYVLMIDSPVEGVHTSFRIIAVSAASQWPWFLGGIVSGPGYGLLGYWWRSRRSWLSAALAATPLLFEPVIAVLGLRYTASVVASCAEALAGLVLAAGFAVAIARFRRQPVARAS